jgi:hypothetical protein
MTQHLNKIKQTWKISALLLVAALSFSSLLSPQVHADVAQSINFQGRLVEPATKNPLDGSFDFTFRICDSLAGGCTGGNKLWETVDKTITVDNGVFETVLGSDVAIDSSVFSGSAQYLEIVVEGETLSPRERLVAVPTALRAAVADSLEPGDGNYIQLVDTLQAGATFFVSSASVATDLYVGDQVQLGGILIAGSGNTQLTNAAGELDATNIDATTLVPNAAIDSSSITKLGSNGLVPNELLDSSSLTMVGNSFNVAQRLLKLNVSGEVDDALLNTSSITKQGNTFNVPDRLLVINSGGFVPNDLIDASSVTKMNAAGLVPNFLLDSASVTLQGNIFNTTDRLAKLDANSDLTMPFGVAAATGRFTDDVGIGTTNPAEALEIEGGNVLIDGGGLQVSGGDAEVINGDVILSTTAGSQAVQFQDGSRQITAPRWEFIETISAADDITFSGLDGNNDDQYLLIFEVYADGNEEWGIVFNGDTGNNYESVNMQQVGQDANITGDDSATQNRIEPIGDIGQGAGDFFMGEMLIFARVNPAAENRTAMYRMVWDDNGNHEFIVGGGRWENVAANITSIGVNGQYTANSRFTLYRRNR